MNNNHIAARSPGMMARQSRQADVMRKCVLLANSISEISPRNAALLRPGDFFHRKAFYAQRFKPTHSNPELPVQLCIQSDP